MQKATAAEGESKHRLASITGNNKKKPVTYAFMYCSSPSTQRQYPRRLKLFFDFIGLEGQDIEEQGQALLDQTTQDPAWANQNVMMYLDHQRQRVLRKEITAGTLRTLWRPIKTLLLILQTHENTKKKSWEIFAFLC